jgi:uncharacterized membrane-anchored protein
MLNNLFNPSELDRSPIPQRNFWLALTAQLLMLGMVAAPALYTRNTGTTVFLQTAPVDPYDLLRGYYQVLGYDISDRAMLQKLPGGEFLQKYKLDRHEFFLTLALPATGERTAAKPIAVSSQQPTNLPKNQIVIRGIANGTRITYDIEKFYMPESEQQNVNSGIDRNRQKLLVETKIDSSGHPVLMRLWVGEKGYSF